MESRVRAILDCVLAPRGCATSCKELVTTLLERWRPETNTFHLIQGEATITLQDMEVLTRFPTRGLPVIVAPDGHSTSEICQQ
ncbi:Serine/threonine-protein phosphatase 7 long form homolog [Linum perenne]